MVDSVTVGSFRSKRLNKALHNAILWKPFKKMASTICYGYVIQSILHILYNVIVLTLPRGQQTYYDNGGAKQAYQSCVQHTVQEHGARNPISVRGNSEHLLVFFGVPQKYVTWKKEEEEEK